MAGIKQLIENTKNYFESNLPTFLASEGVNNFQYYVTSPPKEVDTRELCFYYSNNNNLKTSEYITIIMQAQLPKILDPIGYIEAIDSCIKAMDIESITGFTDLEYDGEAYYLNTSETSGSSSFLYFELSYSKEFDDCDLD